MRSLHAFAAGPSSPTTYSLPHWVCFSAGKHFAIFELAETEGPPKTLFEAAERGNVAFIRGRVERQLDFDINQRGAPGRRACVSMHACMHAACMGPLTHINPLFLCRHQHAHGSALGCRALSDRGSRGTLRLRLRRGRYRDQRPVREAVVWLRSGSDAPPHHPSAMALQDRLAPGGQIMRCRHAEDASGERR
jgi:hypothetical protein